MFEDLSPNVDQGSSFMRSSTLALTIAMLAAGTMFSTVRAEAGVASSPAAQSEAPISTPQPAPAAEPAKQQVVEEGRMICKAERTIGSNRVQRVCRSAEQVRLEREAAREALDKRAICSTCGGGG
ncbi:hypothetical protein [Aerolutibacter daejeonensis]|uniref:hypothetical protein n=1 Tax=Aerolutibacter daejeonensis TaxID=346181 RepID=UPI0012ECA34E|nr:hypothetical protein [Lysobacter daejeonensis]